MKENSSRYQWLAFELSFRNDLSHKQRLALFEAIQVESEWKNFKSPKVPRSASLPNDGNPSTGGDLDSVGLLQQRVGYDGRGFSKDWGDVHRAMNPSTAMGSFIKKLKNIKQENRTSGQLAQLVQVSNFPDKYDAVEGKVLPMIERMYDGCRK